MNDSLTPEEAMALSGEELLAIREWLHAQDEVLEYEQLRRLPIAMMTPDQQARACDLARLRMEGAPEEIRAALERFVGDVEAYGREHNGPRRISGEFHSGIRMTMEKMLRAKAQANGAH